MAIPALFPFFAAGSLLTDTGVTAALGRLCARPMWRLYGLPGDAAGALVLGLTGGYPVGVQAAADLYASGRLTREQAERLLGFCNNTGPAFIVGVCGAGVFGSVSYVQAAADLYASGRLTREQAERLLGFCNNTGPAFIVGVCGAGVFGSVSYGLILYGIHISAALLTGLAMTHPGQGAPPDTGRAAVHRPPFSAALVRACERAAQTSIKVAAFITLFAVFTALLDACGARSALSAACPFSAALVRACERAAQTSIKVAAFITLFAVFTALLDACGARSALSAACEPLCRMLSLPAHAAQPLTLGALELTRGLLLLPETGLPLHHALPAASMLLAFGGLSVWCQSASLAGTLSLRRCWIGILLPETGLPLHHALPAASMLLAFGGLSVWCQSASLAGTLSLRRCWIGKVLHAMVAGALTVFWCAAAPHPLPAFAPDAGAVPVLPLWMRILPIILFTITYGKQRLHRL